VLGGLNKGGEHRCRVLAVGISIRGDLHLPLLTDFKSRL
jgi:hypothetical protein